MDKLIILFDILILASATEGSAAKSVLEKDFTVVNSRNKVYCDSINKSELSTQYLNSCDPWHYCSNGLCKCGPEIPNEVIKCSNHTPLAVLTCFCATSNSEGVTEVGHCIYNCGNPLNNRSEGKKYFPVHNNLCGEKFKRKGILCSSCEETYFPQVHSFDMDCIKCPEGKSNTF